MLICENLMKQKAKNVNDLDKIRTKEHRSYAPERLLRNIEAKKC